MIKGDVVSNTIPEKFVYKAYAFYIRGVKKLNCVQIAKRA